MTSTHALLPLASKIIENNSEIAGPLLIFVTGLLKAKDDPMGEKTIFDVKRMLYSKTEHSEAGMERFISEGEEDLSHLAA